MVPSYQSIIVVFVGLVLGSFGNVVVYRWPRQISLIFPNSFCPACKIGIKFYDNIPVLSYLILKGKCRFCKAPISPRYPLVELACGVLAYLLFKMLGLSIDLAGFFLFCLGLLALSLIDLETELIPNIITLPLAGLGLIFSFFSDEVGPGDSVLGVLAGAGFFFLISVGYKALRGREGLGFGDVKLMGMIGAFLGWQGLLPTILIGSFSGLVAALALFLLKGWKYADPIPFGPFLSLGAVVSLFLKISLRF